MSLLYSDDEDLDTGLTDWRPRRRLVCNNGATVSIQVGRFMHCLPVESIAKITGYYAVEAGFPSADAKIPLSWLKYAEERESPHQTVYNNLPYCLVDQFISDNGGFKDGDLPNRSDSTFSKNPKSRNQ